MKKIALLFLLIFGISSLFGLKAQFTLSAELRTRGEANHGLLSLPIESSETAFFVSQRTRLNFNYKNDNFNTFFSVQDVRFWGQEDIASKSGIQSNTSGLDVSQAWFDWTFAKNWGLKTGRQIWKYDDGRILASRNWNQYGLSWDAFLLHLDKDDFHFHFGSSINNTYVLFNNSSFNATGNSYEEPLGYRIKYFNFVWAKFQASKSFDLSVSSYVASYLKKDTKSTYYSLGTTGVHANFHQEKLKVLANIFYQYGKNAIGQNVSAYMLTIAPSYQLGKFNLGLAYDYLSGDKDDENFGAFDLMYGGRFIYAGWMNYYTLVSSTKNNGLTDLYAHIKWSASKKHSLMAVYHFFGLAQESFDLPVGGSMSYNLNKNLGSELDFNYTYKYDKTLDIQLIMGYYFATETTEYMKGVPSGASTSPYWVSLMLTYKPELFRN